MIKVGEASATATVSAPLETIDLGEWLFTLSSEEYAACATGHQSAAQGRLPSGKRVSINLEFVAGYFMVQHYIEQLAQRDRVVVVSPNTVMWIDDERFVLTQITWELWVTATEDRNCTLTCKVTVETQNEMFAQRAQEANRGIPPDQTPFQRHLDEETPLFAKDIEGKAKQGVWGG